VGVGGGVGVSIKPFWTYYGGKYRAALHYPYPIHETIIEPFAGAAGYALRYSERKIILVEKNPKVAATWRYLLRVTAKEVRDLPLLQAGQTVDDLSVCEEARYLIGWNLNKGATAPCRSPSAWMRSGKVMSQFWSEERRERVASQVDRIRHWQFIEGDYTDAPDIEATWFIDPPYIGAGKHYPTQPDDFKNLGDWCRERKGQVMVCENVGATWLPFKPFMNIKANESKRGGKVSQEALWVNEI
jgi:site-specific DNA-adenine methylase